MENYGFYLLLAYGAAAVILFGLTYSSVRDYLAVRKQNRKKNAS